jgi:hypothetical protein
MGYSAKIKIDTKRPRKDGNAAIFLQVIVDRKKARIDLDISWPPSHFTETTLCKSRSRKDPDVEEYNVIIENARTKANAIHKDYLLRGLHLTLESFLKEYRTNLNKNDFIQYFAQQSFERWNKRRISDDTYEKEKGTIKRLLGHAQVLPFHEFHPDWAYEFDKYLKDPPISNDHNTRFARHKHVITYLNRARHVDKITFTDPYQRFKNKMVEGSWKPLALDEMKSLIQKYLDWKDNPLGPMKRKVGVKQKDDERQGLTKSEIIVLRRFLFSCNCALRISDLQALDRSMFVAGQMSIVPKKTEGYGTKIQAVPLNDVARMMLDDELADNPREFRIFDRYTDQAANKILKRIRKKAGLEAKLHNHVARYTFASLMDQAGANHTGLMKYMGLRKRDTLEKYVKTNNKVITADIEKLNEMIKAKSATPVD